MELKRTQETQDFRVTVSVSSLNVEGHSFMSDVQYDVQHELGQIGRQIAYKLQEQFDNAPTKKG